MMSKRDLLTDFFRKNTVLLFLTFFSGLMNSITNLLIPVFVGKYYQLALQTHSAHGRLFDKILVHLNDLNLFFFLFACLVLFKVFFTFWEQYLAGYSAEVFSKKLREDLLQAQLAFTMPAFYKKAPGKYLLRYSGDLNAIQRYVINGILKFSIDMLFLVFAFVVLALINFQLTLILFLAFPAFFSIIFFFNKYLQWITIKRRNIRSENLAFVSSRLHSLLTVKIFNRESIEHQKFVKNSENLFQYGKKYFQLYGFISSLFPFFLYTLLGVMLVYSHYLRDEFPAYELLIFLMVMINILPLLRRLLRINLVWQAGNVSINKILLIFNSEMEAKDTSEEFKFKTGHIEINNLRFAFPNGKEIFNGFSCIFPDGKITLLNGRQGSGKTTLMKIIVGIYTPQQGDIFVDHNNIILLNKHVIRKNITMVSDELPLIGKSIFEVISYSRKEEKREKALQMLQKLNFSIAGETEIPLDYRVDEGGRNLSAGQRKILLIARALLTGKKIFLMDEPFKDLDNSARTNLVEVLKTLKEKRTIILISSDPIPENEFLYDNVIDLNPVKEQ